MTAAPNLLVLTKPADSRRFGLAHWMREVLEQCDKVRGDFAPDPVHDLRVALRRCRSLADGFIVLDSRPAWKQMKRAGKQLFSQLGALRDLHVMQEWIQHLAPADDPVARFLLDLHATKEPALKQAALAALENFDRDRWQNWADVLPRRAEQVPAGSLVFRHLALERWNAAYDLHHRALRNRSKTGYHQLRIGLKKFRYTVENFLPELHEAWGDDLKKLQDWLGEVHDLDVLWATALQAKAFPGSAETPVGEHSEGPATAAHEPSARSNEEDERRFWHSHIESEREQRLQKYRDKMIGPHSPWQVWRAELPQGAEIESGAMERLRVWAGFLDPDVSHSEAITAIALKLFDGLAESGFHHRNPRSRDILEIAALAHEVGRAKRDRKHQKISARYIREFDPPLGWRAQDLQLAALVARYHRGALPAPTQARFGRLSETQKDLVRFLAGILRLAESLHGGKAAARAVTVEKTGDFLTVWLQGILQGARQPEKVAAARYLLEAACGCPILVRQAARRK